MNVIVWQSYGNVLVFGADTPGQLSAILAHVQTATSRWGIDEHFNDLAFSVTRHSNNGRFDRARNELVSFVRRHCRDTDAFELFETSQVQ